MIDEIDVFDAHETDLVTSEGKSWSRCTLVSWEAIQNAAQGDASTLVWPDEGRFTKTGSWRFNENHLKFQPLILDKITAKAIILVYEAVNDTHKEKIVSFVEKNRNAFGLIVKFAWSKVTVAGFKSV